MSVSNDFDNEASGRAEVLIKTAREDFSRMVVICKVRKAQGVTEEEAQFAEAYARENTAKTYDNGWNRWVITWYADKQVDCCEHDIRRLVQFLIESQMYSDLSE